MLTSHPLKLTDSYTRPTLYFSYVHFNFQVFTGTVTILVSRPIGLPSFVILKQYSLAKMC